jgi:hypothetical protein
MTKLGTKLSKAGSITSLVCAVHCALTPLAILAIPFISVHAWDGFGVWLDGFWASTTEWVFFGVIAVLAGFGLLATYPLHRDLRPALLTILGLGVLTGSHLWMEAGAAGEIVMDVSGAGIIAGAGFWNRRLCHCLGCHSHQDRETSPSIPAVPDLSSSKT